MFQIIFLFLIKMIIAPRARSNHLWYDETFPDYPKSRKALILFIF
ncbi:MAG TPA: hypothetical protein ENH75_01000 [archaeon]|nr:hypothetical protein [archaeon]